MTTLGYMIVATFGQTDYYWAGRDDQNKSMWCLALEDAYKVPSYHYLRCQMWYHLPSEKHLLEGEQTQEDPKDFRIIERGTDNVVRPAYFP